MPKIMVFGIHYRVVFVSENKRARILDEINIEEIYGQPIFTANEREYYFSLNDKEKYLVDSLKTTKGKILFILQLGIFKKKKIFFPSTHFKSEKDHIRLKYFPDYGRSSYNMSRETISSYQSMILTLLDYQKCNEKERKKAKVLAVEFSRISLKREYIFKRLKEFFDRKRLIIPSYSFFQKIIANALSNERKRLGRIIKKECEKNENLPILKQIIDLINSPNLATLKEDVKNFSLSEIRSEISRIEQILPLLNFVELIVEKLNISNEGVRSYSDFLEYYEPFRIRKLNKEVRILHLICFISLRYQRANNNIISAFIYHINKMSADSKEYSKNKFAEIKGEYSPYFKKLNQIIDLFLDESTVTIPFSEIKEKAFKIIPKESMAQLSSYLIKNDLDNYEFEWRYIDENFFKVSNYLRPIIKHLNLESTKSSEDIFTILSRLIKLIDSSKTDSLTKDQTLLEIIPKNLQKYICDKSTINIKRYEYFIYKTIRNRILSGEIFLNKSTHFKSFEEDLCGFSKNSVLDIAKKSNLPILKKDINRILDSLSFKLEERYAYINDRLNENPHVKINKVNDNYEWSLTYESNHGQPLVNFFKDTNQIGIDDLLRIVDSKCFFCKEFKHSLPKGTNYRPDKEMILAGILSAGTNLGLYRMSQISNIEFKKLLYIAQNYINKENLIKANTVVINMIQQLPIFKYFTIDWEGIHSSSDGQKFETQFDTIRSRYSSKYFGLNKGITDYALIAGHIPINSKVIGANEYEGHYVFDLLYNNDTNIIPQSHSTDNHGVNQVNFAILDFFGYYFAPRFRKFTSKTKDLYSICPLEKYKKSVIKPNKIINKKLIIEEWDSIKKIIFSLENKSTTQSIIIQKLCSYPRKNKTRMALWEYNNIIKTIYMLDYIDDIVLRKNVQKSLNIGEHFNQLKRVIAFANFGRLKARNEIEQEIWSHSCRLIGNCIIYYNSFILSSALKKSDTNFLKALNNFSPIAWNHINFYGTYEFYKKIKPDNLEKMTTGVLEQLPIDLGHF